MTNSLKTYQKFESKSGMKSKVEHLSSINRNHDHLSRGKIRSTIINKLFALIARFSVLLKEVEYRCRLLWDKNRYSSMVLLGNSEMPCYVK